jgi:adenylate cyclase
MAEEQPSRVERRLAAILAADVVGYSRLMGLDEAGTARVLREHRAVIDALVAKHGGRIVKTTGDGLLIEFPSVVDAVECAVAMQALMAERNEGVTPDLRMLFRIGVNLGDVLVEGDDILGDGVNVAARLEGIAEPGGICISSSAYDQVRGKVGVEFADLGERNLKNIVRPVRVYGVQAGKPEPRDSDALPTLSGKPSIAVLPFQNMTGDPEQDYFADGMVEDIITALSRAKWFFVVARNSSFIYKGKAVDIKQVGRELGVRYVLEGSVRKAGNRVRITGQLIEAATQHHIWADRFEGSIEDVFALQDSVTESVVGAIEPSLRKAEIVRGRSKPTENLDAYDCYLRAVAALYQVTLEGHDIAETYLKRAIALDPHYASAKARYAYSFIFRRVQGWARPGDGAEALTRVREALAEDSDDPLTLARAAMVLTYFAKDYDQAVILADRAVDLDPNSAEVLIASAWVHCFNCANPGKAIEQFTRAMRLSPRDPDTGRALCGLAFANLIRGSNDEGLQWSQKALQELPNLTVAHRAQILALVRLNRMDDARETAQRMIALDPGFTIATRMPPYRDDRFREELHGALQSVGLLA